MYEFVNRKSAVLVIPVPENSRAVLTWGSIEVGVNPVTVAVWSVMEPEQGRAVSSMLGSSHTPEEEKSPQDQASRAPSESRWRNKGVKKMYSASSENFRQTRNWSLLVLPRVAWKLTDVSEEVKDPGSITTRMKGTNKQTNTYRYIRTQTHTHTDTYVNEYTHTHTDNKHTQTHKYTQMKTDTQRKHRHKHRHHKE